MASEHEHLVTKIVSPSMRPCKQSTGSLGASRHMLQSSCPPRPVQIEMAALAASRCASARPVNSARRHAVNCISRPSIVCKAALEGDAEVCSTSRRRALLGAAAALAMGLASAPAQANPQRMAVQTTFFEVCFIELNHNWAGHCGTSNTSGSG